MQYLIAYSILLTVVGRLYYGSFILCTTSTFDADDYPGQYMAADLTDDAELCAWLVVIMLAEPGCFLVWRAWP